MTAALTFLSEAITNLPWISFNRGGRVHEGLEKKGWKTLAGLVNSGVNKAF
jgi:hypothetical protein